MAEQSGKFKNLIGQMKGQADQTASQPDNQIASQPDDQTSSLPPTDTDKPDTQATIKPDDQIASQPDEVKRVNLCVKVPEHWRKHWAIQARVHDTTMTEVMIEALTARFGLPDDQTTR